MDQTDSRRHHVSSGSLISGPQSPIPAAASQHGSPLKHRLHVLNLLTGEFLELRVRVEDAVEPRRCVALVDVKSAGQFG